MQRGRFRGRVRTRAGKIPQFPRSCSRFLRLELPVTHRSLHTSLAQGVHHPRLKARIVMTQIPLQITFDGLAHSNPIEAAIRERMAWLEQYYPRVTGCRVLVKVPHRHQHAGRQFHVVVDVSVPGGAPIVVSHHPSPLDGAPDFETAIRQAFDAVRRQLQDFAREQRVPL